MKKSEMFLLFMMTVFILCFMISPAIEYWIEKGMASADVILEDNNGHVIPYAMVSLKSLTKNGYEIKKSILNGRGIVGKVDKGDYELKVWFGDLDRIDHLLYTKKVYLKNKEEIVVVRLDNVTQRILILVAEPNIAIPVSPANESVKIKPYQK